MRRLIGFVFGVVLLPLGAAAQGIPPIPPIPVAPPVPPAPVYAPMPPLPPLPRMDFELGLQDRMLELQDRLSRSQPFRLSADEQHRIADDARNAAEHARAMVKSQMMMFDLQGPFINVDVQGPFIGGRGDDESGAYNSGLSALQRRQYDRAITLFDRVLAQKGPHADAATYWKAFSQARLVRTDDALATLAGLRRDYPQSRYASEAKVLEADVRKLSGQNLDAQALDANDEIKLMAINGIANTDPDRAIPLLEGVLSAANTLGNKKRALFVLALSKDPRAHQILLRYAKGAGNPELQVEAIRNLVSRRDGQTSDTELREIYLATEDTAIRRAIIDAYASAGDKTALIAIIKSKTEGSDLKQSAIGRLSGLAAPAELWALYQQEPDPALRVQLINVLASMSAIDQLSQIAKTDKDPKVRLRALRSLGGQKSDQTGKLLVDLYSNDQDRDARRTVISALRNQNNADALVAIARKESSLDLKREIVSALSDMAPKNKVAADYLMEVIK